MFVSFDLQNVIISSFFYKTDQIWIEDTYIIRCVNFFNSLNFEFEDNLLGEKVGENFCQGDI